MQMAIDVAGFSAAEADQLRQAMDPSAALSAWSDCGHAFMPEWRNVVLMARWPTKFGRRWQHLPISVSRKAIRLASPISFTPPPGSNSITRRPFLAGLLDSQPMGFWSPQSLVLDARRHGVEVRRPDMNASADFCPGTSRC